MPTGSPQGVVAQIRGLGAKFGEQVQQQLGVTFVGELARVPFVTMSAKFDEKTAAWLRHVAKVDRGVRRWSEGRALTPAAHGPLVRPRAWTTRPW